MGSGLLYAFRCTFADGGRLLWVEADATLDRMRAPTPASSAPATDGSAKPSHDLTLPRLQDNPARTTTAPACLAPGPTHRRRDGSVRRRPA